MNYFFSTSSSAIQKTVFILFFISQTFIELHAQIHVFDFEISGYEQNPPIANIFPTIISVDAEGNVFLAESGVNSVHKFNKDGVFIKKWEVTGARTLDNALTFIRFLSVDASGNVYVTGDDRSIKKYTNDGVFITQWGSATDNIGGMSAAVDVDGSGNVYTLCSHTDMPNQPINKVKKFSSTGTLLATWGTQGVNDGEIYYPSQLKADNEGNVYVMDQNLQKFTSTGEFLFKIDLSVLRTTQSLISIATDKDNNLYTVNSGNFVSSLNYNDLKIDKYNASGTYISSVIVAEGYTGNIDIDAAGNIYLAYQNLNRGLDPAVKVLSASGSSTSWPAFNDKANGQFTTTTAIATDLSGNVFVLDNAQKKIQKFNSSGQFITSWRTRNYNSRIHYNAFDLAVDQNGNVYITEADSIQKFNNNGLYIKSWCLQSINNSLYNAAEYIGIDGIGNVYVSNSNQNIQKFTSDGDYILNWDIRYSNVNSMAVDISGFVYLTYVNNNRIYSYTNTGVPVDILGDYILEQAEYHSDYQGIKLALDPLGNIYFTDPKNYLIQKIDVNGRLMDTWSQYGCLQGKINGVMSLAVDELGYIYVADSQNRRIQKFRPTSLPPTGIATRIDNRIENAELLTIYPNPSSGSFTIRMEEDIQSVTLINSTGATEIHTGKEITTTFTGLICVEIQTAKTRVVKKLIIQ